MSRKNGGRRPPGDYAIGYGRPPTANQFKPGQSGNPSGRRPKPTDDQAREVVTKTPSLSHTELDELISDELNRTVDAQENGHSIKLSALRAVVRSMGLSAMKGRTQAQRQFLQLAHAAQANEHDRRARARDLVHGYRRYHPEAVRAFEKRYPGKFCYLAHPDDVFYNEELGIMDFAGPFTEAAWQMMNAREYLCKQIFIAIQDMLCVPATSAILNQELREFAVGLYNAAERIRRELPVRLHAGIEQVKPKDWVPDPHHTSIDLIYFWVLGPLPPGLLKSLEAEPMVFDFFKLAMARLDRSGKGDGINRTRHCISALGQKLTPAERSHALEVISGSLKPSVVSRRLWELGRKELVPGHLICNARSAASRIHSGQDVAKVISDFRESVNAG